MGLDTLIGTDSPFAKNIGDKVCPDLGHMIKPGLTPNTVELSFFKCLKNKCAQFDEKNNKCGKIVFTPITGMTCSNN